MVVDGVEIKEKGERKSRLVECLRVDANVEVQPGNLGSAVRKQKLDVATALFKKIG